MCIRDSRSYTVNCHDKDGSTFRSYTMQTVEGQEEPLNFTYTDYTYDENGNCTDAVTTDKTNHSTSEYRRSYDDKNRVLRTENYEGGELSASSETVYTEVDNGQSSACLLYTSSAAALRRAAGCPYFPYRAPTASRCTPF